MGNKGLVKKRENKHIFLELRKNTIYDFSIIGYMPSMDVIFAYLHCQLSSLLWLTYIIYRS
jgi:hypothetical protein